VLFGDDSSDPRGALSSTSLSLSKRARGAFNRREPRLALQFRKKKRRKRKKRCSWPAAFLASDATFSIKRGKNSHFLVALAALSLSLSLPPAGILLLCLPSLRDKKASIIALSTY
jgi:hypothetical protein